jgi:hypothetical protein
MPAKFSFLATVLAATLAALPCCGLLTLPAAAQDTPADPRLLRPADRPVELSDEIVHDVLLPFQIAIETHNLDHLLATFDPAATPDFPQIRDQFRAFFRLTDTVKFRYQILQAAAGDHDTSYAIADIDMDALPADALPTEQRRSTQMRFQMTRTPKGWRLTALKPMDFFTQ